MCLRFLLVLLRGDGVSFPQRRLRLPPQDASSPGASQLSGNNVIGGLRPDRQSPVFDSADADLWY